MDLTLRVVVAMILILIGMLVFASLILDWGGDIRAMFDGTTSILSDFILNE
jgi:hypothetical protein